MAKFNRTDTNKSLESLLDMDKSAQIAEANLKNNVVRKQTSDRKLIPGRGLEFNHLSYSVVKKQKKDGVWITKEAYLLNDISGQALRGEILAIMGPSGAGKSTFLDAIAGRIAQGSLEGSVRIDGKPVSTSYMKMVSSYVMQDEQLFPMLTIFETFMFAAEVRLPPSISRFDKKKRVIELLEQLGLTAKTITELSPAPHTQPPSSFPMNGTTPGSLHPQECGPKCTVRCSKTQYKKPCMFFCQKCCAKCLCVPPGTYGNKQFCPCYNNWKTKRGGPKCP